MSTCIGESLEQVGLGKEIAPVPSCTTTQHNDIERFSVDYLYQQASRDLDLDLTTQMKDLKISVS